MVENDENAYWQGLSNTRGFYCNSIDRGENCRELVDSKAPEKGMERIDQILNSSKKMTRR
jgi:hypothetical protein